MNYDLTTMPEMTKQFKPLEVVVLLWIWNINCYQRRSTCTICVTQYHDLEIVFYNLLNRITSYPADTFKHSKWKLNLKVYIPV